MRMLSTVVLFLTAIAVLTGSPIGEPFCVAYRRGGLDEVHICPFENGTSWAPSPTGLKKNVVCAPIFIINIEQFQKNLKKG